MRNEKILQTNEKLLIEAFTLQNEQAYDEALEKLEIAGNNFISTIEDIEKSAQFYMRIMPIMKNQRQLVSERDYKQFINKNQRTFSKNFEKNTYLALLMQEMEEQSQRKSKKWTAEDEQKLERLVLEESSCLELQEKFPEFDPREVRRRYSRLCKKNSAKDIENS